MLTLFVESTFTAQSFWSENVMLPLVTAILWLTLRVPRGPRLSSSGLRAAAAALGLMLGLAVISRAVPILLLPAVLLFTTFEMERSRWRSMTRVAVTACVAVVLLQMTANLVRFGRFELSRSTGLHLWNAVAQDADVILAEEPLYRQMKAEVPDIAELWWWDLPREVAGVADNEALEAKLRPILIRGISRHPGVFLRSGLIDLFVVLPRAPTQNGYLRAEYYNPLGRETMLPAPGRASPTLLGLLDSLYIAGRRGYAYLIPGALVLGLVALAVMLVRRAAFRDCDVRLWLVCAYSFVAPIYLSNQIERLDPRYALPYLGVAALLVSLSVRLAVQVVWKARKSSEPG